MTIMLLQFYAYWTPRTGCFKKRWLIYSASKDDQTFYLYQKNIDEKKATFQIAFYHKDGFIWA